MGDQIEIPTFARLSPRYLFQWIVAKNVLERGGTVLNVGCSDDPLKFGDLVTHFDFDDWSKVHKNFVQGDAHELSKYVGKKSFTAVILGDVLEHVPEPHRVAEECCAVARRYVAMTIFKEWRLPGHGQWVDEGWQIATKENQRMGYANMEAYQEDLFPLRVAGDVDFPHLHHINQFDRVDIDQVIKVMEGCGFWCEHFKEVQEPVLHEGHPLVNWVVLMRSIDNAGQASEELEAVS